jgi:hypothetical protein
MTRAKGRCEQNAERNRQHDPNAEVSTTKRLDHDRLAFSIQRLRNNGQSAITPGKIKSRKPALDPRATGSTVAIPMVTKADAKRRPRATYAKAALRR